VGWFRPLQCENVYYVGYAAIAAMKSYYTECVTADSKMCNYLQLVEAKVETWLNQYNCVSACQPIHPRTGSPSLTYVLPLWTVQHEQFKCSTTNSVRPVKCFTLSLLRTVTDTVMRRPADGHPAALRM
jgi:hypothetical protein